MERTKMMGWALSLVLGLIMGPTASAQWYVGGNVGESRTQYSDSKISSDLGALGVTATGSASETAVGGKLFVGYQLNDNFALEGGYFYLGNFLRISGTATAPTAASFNGSDQGQGVNMDLVGMLPFGKGFSGIGRLGAAYFRSDATAAASAVGNVSPATGTANRGILEAGLGLQYDFTKTVAGRLEWLRYFNATNSLTGSDVNIDLYSAGLVVKF